MAILLLMPTTARAQETVYLPIVAFSGQNTQVDAQAESDGNTDAAAEVEQTPESVTAQAEADDGGIPADIFETDEVLPEPQIEEEPVLPEPNDPSVIVEDAAVLAAGADAAQWNVIGNWELTGQLGVGTQTPSTKVHVIGNRIRLQNGTKILDLRADGSDVDLQTWTNDLYLRSTGAGHHMFLNPFGSDGRVYIGAGGTSPELNVRGGIRTNGSYPIYIRRFQNIGNNANINIGLSSSQWHCVATGWSARWDILENGTGNNHVWTYVSSGTWRLRVNFYSHNDHENPDIDVLCFRREIAVWTGASPTLFDPD